METLEQVFDYREWFHFDVLVAPVGGQWHRLTDRMAGTRSGAEQLFALYVPLFAALAALYRSAAPGAPRLLALDEAFDKVSVANTQRIVKVFLARFPMDHDWTTNQRHGSENTSVCKIPYDSQKGWPTLTSASFWSDSQSQKETMSKKK